MRVKSKWYRNKKPKSVEELAGVVAFNAWKAASTSVNKMYSDGFNFNSNEQILQVIGEFVVFLLQAADRLAYERLDEEERVRFTTAMAKHLIGTMQENMSEELGAGEYREPFINMLNERAAGYAEFPYTNGEPSYHFLRYFGDSVDKVMGGEQNKWVPEHIVDVESPVLLKTLNKVVDDMLGQREDAMAEQEKGPDEA